MANNATAAVGTSAEIEAALDVVRTEINQLSDRVRELRRQEADLQQQLLIRRQQESVREDQTVHTKIKQLEADIQRRDSQIAELNASMQRALQDRKAMESDLQSIVKYTKTRYAGGQMAVQPTVDNVRYDLSPEVLPRTGSSADPLTQTGIPVRNHMASPAKNEGLRSTDELGERPTASPFVRPEDYVMSGSRPASAAPSARFKDWRRPASRVSQPPGGRSTLGNILG